MAGMSPFPTRRRVLVSGLALPLAAAAQSSWSRIEQAARGQTVYFNAWAGSERVNAYLQWAAGELKRQFDVKLEHVKITDTVEAVRRVRAEKAASRVDGSVDMVWINGENFLAMKREGLAALVVPLREDRLQRELLAFVSWYNLHRPHTTLGVRTPDEVYFGRRPACRSPRFEPRERWPRGSPCAAPHALVRGQPGARVELSISYHGKRKHLPVVTLHRAA